jgi:DNA-binding transcriptional ArsR family regulator
MYNDTFKPEAITTLSSQSQIKAYVHPTRIMLLQFLAREKRTISSVAKELGVHPANITYHFKLLEKEGLITIVEKRDTGKNLEKYYRACAYTFIIRPDAQKVKSKEALTLSILKNDLTVAINTVQKADHTNVVALLKTVTLSAENANKFNEYLHKVVKDFETYRTPQGTSYNLNISMYPNDVKVTGQNQIIIE